MIWFNKIISVFLLFVYVLNIPSVALELFSVSVSSPLSYFVLCIAILHVFNNYKLIKSKKLKLFYVISLIFFLFALLQYHGELRTFIVDFLKFSFYFYSSFISFYYVSRMNLLIIVVLGVSTILLDALFFRFNDVFANGYVMENGRYSGFYLNANSASAMALFGYIIALFIKHKLRVLILLFFTFMGFLTLSRTFIFSWLLINLIFGYYNKKHFKYIPIVFLLFPILIFFKDRFSLRADRFDFLINLFTNGSINRDVLTHDSRDDMWAKYYDYIFNNPFFGNGYYTFRSGELVDVGLGVHNTFLVVIGESGIIPFILFLFFFLYFLRKTTKNLNYSLHNFLLLLIILIQFMVSHTFFSTPFRILFLTFLIFSYEHNFNFKKN